MPAEKTVSVRYTVPETPFDDVKKWEDDSIFNLTDQASALTSFVSNIEEPQVIGFQADWGAGKTTFLKRWKYLSEKRQSEGEPSEGEASENKHESQKKFKTVYFDAFEHDFFDDPFPALMSEVLTQLGRTLKDEIYKKGISVIKAASNIAGVGFAGEAIDKFFENQKSRKKEIEGFREELTNTANKFGRIVIIIDELDRCKPDFALSMLEYIKHLFNVQNVHFILGYNAQALEGMIKIRYGTDIDAHRYLDKFITVNMKHMPIEKNRDEYSRVQYFEKKYSEMSLGKLDGAGKRYQRHAVAILIQHHKPSLRDINQFLTHLALTPASKSEYTAVFVAILKLMRILNSDLYNQIRQVEKYSNSKIEAVEIRKNIKAWLGDYDIQTYDPERNREIEIAVSYFLDMDGFANIDPLQIHQGESQTNNNRYTEAGVYKRLEEDIFAEIERIATISSAS